MPFGTCNPYYLRISEMNVLPLYVYLDERHLDWMSDRVLQHVLADIRPLIIPKLQAETDVLYLGPGAPAHAKKGTVDVHRGDFYQFCFFFRKTEPHSVLIKNRNFSAIPQTRVAQKCREKPTSATPSGKRKNRTTHTNETDGGRKKRRTRGKGKTRGTIYDEEVLSKSSGDSDHSIVEVDHPIQSIKNIRRNSTRFKKIAPGGYRDGSDSETSERAEEDSFEWVESGSSDDEAPSIRYVKDEPMDVGLPESTAESPTADVELEEDESKPKPILKLGYSNFSIYGRCLCVVVEPWPPLPKTTKEPTVTELRSTLLSASSLASPGSAEADCRPVPRLGNQLSLPEFDSDERSLTTAGEGTHTHVNSFLASTIQDTHQEDDDDGMILFSQVLNSAGNFRTSVTNDDDEMDGEAFLGDADEVH